jgi:hypothetical protein
LLAQAQTSSTQPAPRPQPLVWQFSRGQEFFIEENQRQLYLAKNGDTRINSYLDYSLLKRYQVKSMQERLVELEATWEKVRVNNLSEAGKEAVDTLKKQEGTKHTYYLRKKDQTWQVDPDKNEAQEAIFSTLLFTLGTASFDADHPSWTARWPVSIPSQGQIQLVMKMQTKPTEIPMRLRSEVRAEFELLPLEGSAATSIQLENTPTATPGWGSFDARRVRWEYLDFRVICVFKTTQGERRAEIKQDFIAVYRVYDSRPFWPEK